MNSSTADRSRGFLLFAHDNDHVKYGDLALCNALLIKKTLRQVTDVTLVTDRMTMGHLRWDNDPADLAAAFDNIIVLDDRMENNSVRRYHDTRYSTFRTAYHNGDRPSAFDLSPYDETVLLDVDYLVLDDSLDSVWGSAEDFMCNHRTRDLNHAANDFGFDNRFNDMSIPLYWATAMYWKKTELPAMIFELMKFVKDHYAYYQYLYRFMSSGYYRNDYALSIAIHWANNLMEIDSVASLPTDHILFSMEHDQLHAFDQGRLIITSEPTKGDFRLHAVDSNVHMMNKRAVQRFKQSIIDHARS